MKKSLLTLGAFLFFTASLLAYDLADSEENDAHFSQNLSCSADKDCESPLNTEIGTDSVATNVSSHDSDYDSDDEYSSGTDTDTSEEETDDHPYINGLPRNTPNNASPQVLNIFSLLMNIADLAYKIPNQNQDPQTDNK